MYVLEAVKVIWGGKQGSTCNLERIMTAAVN